MKNTWTSLDAGVALIILLTVVAYQPAIHGDFVFDDQRYITNNQLARADDGLYRMWMTTAQGEYYPLTTTLWWFQWRWWGSNPMGYHVVNVVLHALNAVLVWLILKGLRIRGAWWAGLVFALHPVNVATAAWVSELKNTLSMFFGAITVLLYLRFEQEARRRWYVLSLVTFLLALLSKAAVVMLPFFLLGCVWWRRERVGRKDLLRTAPFFSLSLVLGLVEIWFLNNRELGGHAVRNAGIAVRLAAAGWVPWFYLYKALLPVNLTVIYPNWQIDASRWVSYLPGVALIGCLVLFWWKRKSWGRPLLFGLGYFVVMLFPLLGFVDQTFYQYALVADHWQYYSIVGVIALAVAAGESICRRWGGQGRYWGTAAGVTVLLVLGAATWRRSRVYANQETFWSDNVARNPNAWVAQNNLGVALGEAGRIGEAIGHLEQSLRINPEYANAHNTLGIALERTGKVQEAIRQYEQALRINPNLVEAQSNLARLRGVQ
jgi:hypothetical protein